MASKYNPHQLCHTRLHAASHQVLFNLRVIVAAPVSSARHHQSGLDPFPRSHLDSCV